MRNVGDPGGPETGGQQVPGEKGLPIRHPIRDFREPLVGVRHPDILCLASIDPAAQGPAAVGIGTVVHIPVAAEEAVPAEGLHIDGNPVAGVKVGNGRAHLFYDAHHFMSQGDAWNRPGDSAVFNMQVTGADAGQGHADDGVPRMLEDRLRLVHPGKGTGGDVGIGAHRDTSFLTG